MTEQEKEIISGEEMTASEQSEVNLSEEQTSPEKDVVDDQQAKLQAEVNDWKDKYMRLFAEFDNYKKRTSKEISDLIKTAGKDVIFSMLDVLDDSERASKQMEKATDIDAVKEGVQLIINKLNQVMTSKGVKSFNSIGEDFDVEKHEAITEIPAPTPEMQGKVIDEIHKGYFMNDKLIRHAKVVVGKSETA
jgi:molecular chaperone GrpE